MQFRVRGDGGVLDHRVPTFTCHRPDTRSASAAAGYHGLQTSLPAVLQGNASSLFSFFVFILY